MLPMAAHRTVVRPTNGRGIVSFESTSKTEHKSLFLADYAIVAF
jgi:hypothetical protein